MLILSVKYDIKYFGINLSKDQAGLFQEDINSIKIDYKRLKEFRTLAKVVARHYKWDMNLVLELYD